VSKWGDMVAALDDKPALVGDVIPSTAASSADDAFKGHVVVFTGFRDKALEALIEQHGGKIGAGVTDKTTDLVMRETGSGSSKEKKALQLGVKIWSAADFTTMMKSL
jgi:NAD-dependent DNA ligase